MFIKIFLLLSVLSCSGEKSNDHLISDKKFDQTKVTKEQKSETPITGFMVLKNTYKQEKLLTIYNVDKSKWKSFYLDDKFSLDDIDPSAIKPENTLLVFKCIGQENEFYKVIVNENKNIVKYIKKNDSDFQFQATKEHILTVFSVDFNEKENPLRTAPNVKSQSFPKNKDSFYYPIKTNGDWLMVEDDNKENFWIRWRNSENKLILELYYDA